MGTTKKEKMTVLIQAGISLGDQYVRVEETLVMPVEAGMSTGDVKLWVSAEIDELLNRLGDSVSQTSKHVSVTTTFLRRCFTSSPAANTGGGWRS